jgi:hypothetical protein
MDQNTKTKLHHKGSTAALKKLIDLELGTKFRVGSGTVGFLLNKAIGSATVFVIEVPKSPSFYNEDGSIDPYWTGKLRWSSETEVEVIK